jgi:hypothetical protein
MLIDFWLVEKFRKEAFRIPWPTLVSSGDPKREAEDRDAPQPALYFSKLPRTGGRVLDIGAGEMHLKRALEVRGFAAEYRAMDTSAHSGVVYDYRDIGDVVGEYDLIVLQEVMEHLPLDVGLGVLRRVYELLAPTGFIVVTVPNMYRPVQFFTGFSHITHYPLPDLYGLLRSLGFKGEAILRRVEIRPPGLSLAQRALLHTRKGLYRLLGFDWAHGVLCMVGKE